MRGCGTGESDGDKAYYATGAQENRCRRDSLGRRAERVRRATAEGCGDVLLEVPVQGQAALGDHWQNGEPVDAGDRADGSATAHGGNHGGC